MTPEGTGRGQVGIALEAAAVPPGRRGRERASRLSRGERLLYEWILWTFAAGETPAREVLAVVGSGLEVEVEQALETLARADLVLRDSAAGSILVAYPFSAAPRGHRVLIDGER